MSTCRNLSAVRLLFRFNSLLPHLSRFCATLSCCVWVETSSPAVSLEFQARPKLDPLPPLLVDCLTCRAWVQSQFLPVCLCLPQPLYHHSRRERNKVQSYIYPKTLLRVSFDFEAVLPYLHQGCASVTGQQTENKSLGCHLTYRKSLAFAFCITCCSWPRGCPKYDAARLTIPCIASTQVLL